VGGRTQMSIMNATKLTSEINISKLLGFKDDKVNLEFIPNTSDFYLNETIRLQKSIVVYKPVNIIDIESIKMINIKFNEFRIVVNKFNLNNSEIIKHELCEIVRSVYKILLDEIEKYVEYNMNRINLDIVIDSAMIKFAELNIIFYNWLRICKNDILKNGQNIEKIEQSNNFKFSIKNMIRLWKVNKQMIDFLIDYIIKLDDIVIITVQRIIVSIKNVMINKMIFLHSDYKDVFKILLMKYAQINNVIHEIRKTLVISVENLAKQLNVKFHMNISLDNKALTESLKNSISGIT